MGARYEIRWATNNACPFHSSKWTNNLMIAIIFFIRAVVKGNTSVELIMHDWIDCPHNCPDFEYCPKKVN